jgi:hypothetical protein
MWNMKPRSNDDCFYDCLWAELRSVIGLPSEIATKELFEDWVQKSLSGDRKAFPTSSGEIERLEKLFGYQCRFVIERTDDGKKFESFLPPAKKKFFLVKFRLHNGHYSSPHYKHHTEEMHGLESLEFWLSSLKKHLPPFTENPNSTIFIVGTHLDQAVGTRDSRQRDVMRVVNRIGIDYPVSVHELSFFPTNGVDEVIPGLHAFETDLYEKVTHLPHMGETVPASYLQIQEIVLSVSQRLAQEGKCSLIFSLLYS